MIRFSQKLQLIGSSYFQQTIRILTLFVMARLIGPNDNGIYQLVVYAGSLIAVLSDLVIPQLFVQMREFPEEQTFDTGIVLISLIYIVYGIYAIAAGVFLTWRDPLHDPHYWRIGIIVAVTNFLAGIYSVQLARLNKQLKFGDESRQNVIMALSVAATGLLFAFLNFGAYALALQLLGGQLVANVAINLRVPLTRPRHFSFAVAKRYVQLGTPVSIGGYVRSVEASIIGIIVTPIGGTFGLGLWSKAVIVQSMFGQNLLMSFNRVAYPLVCHSIDEPERMRKLVARVILIFMLVSLLFTVVVGINSTGIVRVCLGPNWIAASPLVSATAWAIPAGALDGVANIVCMALGISKAFIKSSVWNLILFIPTALLVRHLGGGLVGLAICWTVSRYFISLATLAPGLHKMGTKLPEVWMPLIGLLAAGLVAGAAMIGVRWLTPNLRLPIQLVFSGAVGTIIYGIVVLLLEPNTLHDARRMAMGNRAAPLPRSETAEPASLV